MEQSPTQPLSRREQTFSFSTAIQSESCVILSYILNNTSPVELHDRMRKALASRMMLPSDVEYLLWSLNKVGVVTSAAYVAAKDQTVRHCVRCHSKYLERDNGLTVCVVGHDHPRLCKQTRGGESTYMNTFPCCNVVLPLEVAGFAQPHFVGRHTTMREAIAFNGTNLLSCEQRGCDVRGRPPSQAAGPSAEPPAVRPS